MVRLDDCSEEVFLEIFDFKKNKGNEFVTKNEDGSYTIFINSRLSLYAQRLAAEHAIEHIKNGDFDKENVQEIEAMAHNIHERKDNKMDEELVEFYNCLHDYLVREIRRLKKELYEYKPYIKAVRAMHEDDYFDLLEHQYLDPDRAHF